MDNKEIEQIKNGDKETIQAVYKKYAIDVYKFSKNITHDHDLAMKVTEQTFVDLFRRIQKGEAVPDDLRREALKTTYIKAQAIVAEKKAKDEAAAKTDAASVPVKEEIPEEKPEAQEVSESEGSSEPQTVSGPVKESANEPGVPVKEAVQSPQEPAVQAAAEPAEEIPESGPQAADTVFDPEEKPAGAVDSGYVDFRVKFSEEERSETDIDIEENSVSETRVIDISEAPEEGDRIFREDEESEVREKYYVEDEEEEEEKSNKGLFVLLVVLNVILILLLLWLLVGLLVNLEVLPENIDLGYTWFNNHFYPIF